MEELKRTIEGAPLFILRASIIRDIIKDVYTLAETIEWVLRHTPAFRRKAKKDSYETENMKINRCELKAKSGIRMDIQFGKGKDIYNRLILNIESDGDYSICISSADFKSLIITRNDILELLIDLTNNRNYKYIKRPFFGVDHAIIIDNKAVLACIECSKYSDKKYDKLTYDKTKYVSEDTKYDVIICPSLKAAHASDGMLLR